MQAAPPLCTLSHTCTCAVGKGLLHGACAEMLLWVQMRQHPGQHMMKDGSWMKDEDMVRAACSIRSLMCLWWAEGCMQAVTWDAACHGYMLDDE